MPHLGISIMTSWVPPMTRTRSVESRYRLLSITREGFVIEAEVGHIREFRGVIICGQGRKFSEHQDCSKYRKYFNFDPLTWHPSLWYLRLTLEIIT